MKELTLQEIKDIELEILIHFDDFCRKNDLKYYLAYGTLLGAIRYKGFIPWDDDIDVLMPREDYLRLLKIYKDSDKYKLYAYEKDKKMIIPYAKICDTETFKDEFGYNSEVELGIDIDIFPLDYWADDLEEAKREVKKISRDMFCLGLTKLKKPDSVNPAKRFVKGIVMRYCRLRGSEHYVKKIIAASYKHEQNGSRYIGTKSWCVYKERNIIPSEAFSEGVDIEFEGRMIPAPIGYDTYLTCLYGDYLPEPPKEKQKTHHYFSAYKKQSGSPQT